MKVTLLTHTNEPEKIIAAAANLCYSGKADVDSLLESLTPETVGKLIDKLISMGHESPFEHASFTFAIEGVSRAFLAQISRHRVGVSLSVMSQRYVSMEKFETLMPVAIKNKDEARILYRSIEADIKTAYQKMQEMGIKNEDARAILMNAQECRMILTANVRALWHLAYERMCVRSQSEIVAVVTEMIRQCREVAPALFRNAGPKCVKGFCPEGKMSCGKAPTMDVLLKAYTDALLKTQREKDMDDALEKMVNHES